MARLLAALLFLMTAIPAAAQVSVLSNNYQLYIGGFPQQETPWSNDSQGVAHDDNHWFITQTTVIWKIPVGVDLRSASTTSPGVVRRSISIYAPLNGFHHLGDPVVYKFNGVDYLLVPIEGAGHPGSIAVFNCATLAYITHFALASQAGDAGWCAVDEYGVIYSSLQHTTSLTSYVLDWPELQASGVAQVTPRIAEMMRQENFQFLDLATMQGGEFGPGGLLYLVSGFYDDSNGLEDREGLHILEPRTDAQGVVTWHRIAHSTRGTGGHFDFYYDPGFPTYEEPEGLTIWDLDDGRAPGIRGQLHAFVSDNDVEAGDIDFKHYTSTILVRPGIGCLPGAIPGTANCPFPTISGAASFAWNGGHLRIRSGSYPGPITINRRLRLTAEGGLVHIGQ